MPGGDIYVTDSLLYVVKNNEELAGIMCHEAAHTINHDSLDMMEKREEIWRKQIAANLLLGKAPGAFWQSLFFHTWILSDTHEKWKREPT